MTHEFDKDYWEQHWRGGAMGDSPPNPYLAREAGGLVPGTALDAGAGAGAEAIWLALHGWRVTAADISSAALSRAAERASEAGAADLVDWVEADLSVWEPGRTFDLVMTHYAHPAMPQLQFYDRIAAWVAPGGTLLIVGHLSDHHGGDHEHHPPVEATATARTITALLDASDWVVVTAEQSERTIGGHGSPLHDVVVRAVRLPSSGAT